MSRVPKAVAVLVGFLVVGACTSPYRDRIREPLASDGWAPRPVAAREGGDAGVAPNSVAVTVPTSEDAFPIDLSTALGLAGAKGLVIGMARERAVVAVAREELVLSQWFPRAGPHVGFTRIDGLVQGTDGDFVDVGKQNLLLGAGAEWRVNPAATWYASLAARRGTEASTLEITAAGHDVLRVAARGYYDLVQAHTSIAIATRSLLAARELVEVTKTQERLGVGLRSDVLRAEARMRQTEGQLAIAQRDAGVASAVLGELLVLDPGTRLVPGEKSVGTVDFVDASAPLNALFARAQSHRPDLAAARSRLAGAEQSQRGADRAWWWPDLAARGMVGAYGQNFGSLNDQETMYFGLEWRFGAGVPALQREAEAQRRLASLTVTATERRALREIQTAREKIRATGAVLLAAREERTAAREAVQLARAQLTRGEGLLLSVLDVEAALVRAETAHAAAVLDLNRAHYDLLHAVGGPR